MLSLLTAVELERRLPDDAFADIGRNEKGDARSQAVACLISIHPLSKKKLVCQLVKSSGFLLMKVERACVIA